MQVFLVNVTRNAYRVADIAVFAGSHLPSIPETPPLVIVEIVSKDDRYLDLMQKLEEYREWGVPHIFGSSIPQRDDSRCTPNSGCKTSHRSVFPIIRFQLTPAELFAGL